MKPRNVIVFEKWYPHLDFDTSNTFKLFFWKRSNYFNSSLFLLLINAYLQKLWVGLRVLPKCMWPIVNNSSRERLQATRHCVPHIKKSWFSIRGKAPFIPVRFAKRLTTRSKNTQILCIVGSIEQVSFLYFSLFHFYIHEC